MKKISNSIILTESIESNLITLLYKVSENILISNSIKNILKYLKNNQIQLIVINQQIVKESDLEKIRKFEIKILFIENLEKDLYKLNEDFLNKFLNSNNYISKNNKENIFRDIDSFKLSISKEVRRAKRYHYPLVVVMLKLEKNSETYFDEIISFFANRIREFDSLWVKNNNHFNMILPHTGWNGAEILTNRLIKEVTEKFNLTTDSIKNIIKTFKRTESDSEYLERIRNSLDSEYNTITKESNFEIWKDEFLSEFQKGKVVRIFNQYKGMVISHSVDIVHKQGNILEVKNLKPIQKATIEIEKATYFESKNINKMIRAGVHNISKDSIEFSSFEIVDNPTFQDRTLKLIIDEDVPAEFKESQGELFELSFEKAEIIFKGSIPFKNSDSGKLKLKLPLNKEIAEITLNGNIVDYDSSTNETILLFSIESGEKENRIISEYLSKKQMEFINELRNFGK